MAKKVYLDNAASTPIDESVAAEMAQAIKFYGNPSSYNDYGREAREYIEQARLKVARFLGAHRDEVVFTGSGTESNNLAIQGIARNFQFSILPTPPKLPLRLRRPDNFQSNPKLKKSKPHIITTKIEHPSVLRLVGRLEKEGFDVSYLSVDKEGLVNLDELQKKIKPATVLVSVMYANNEIGAIQPIAKIGKIVKEFRKKLEIENWKLKIHETRHTLFHVDACQAAEYLDMNVNHLGVDLLTFNGSKIYGPRGVGVLYVRRGTKLSPIIVGGEQEFGLRAGTENLPAIGGLAVALDNIDTRLTGSGRGKEGKRLANLRDYFMERIKILPSPSGIEINGPVDKRLRKSFINRLPNNVNLSISELTSETLLLELDKYGVYAGSGSACTSHSIESSHVLKAIGVDKKYISGALRFSMGRQTTKKDMDYVLSVLLKVIKDLRKRYKKI